MSKLVSKLHGVKLKLNETEYKNGLLCRFTSGIYIYQKIGLQLQQVIEL